MKWIYGKQDWNTMERGQENCFLLTNNLGGFSSLTMLGSASRNDHALLMASVQAPNHRCNMVHRLKETLEIEGREYTISSQEFAGGQREEGYRYLSEFSYEDTPVWRFQADGVEIRKELGMKWGANAAALCYQIRNRETAPCTLTLMPFFQFTEKGAEPKPGQQFARIGGKISSNGLELYFRTNGTVKAIEEQEEVYFYSYDACDGRREQGRAVANHEISITVGALEWGTLELVYEMEASEDTAEEILSGVKERRAGLAKTAGFQNACARMLSKSADQFVVKRESTGGDTIVAGYPFFEDWGRDTMIALPGLCISTGQFDRAKNILRTFAAYEKDGLMPNLFPEGSNDPMYNTADAALLFINCVYLYYQAVKDIVFAEELYPVMERIIRGYKNGTKYGIHMDRDGLILAGEGLDQVTWMDVRAGEILPTPRHGKPVEINAYWYNALRIMEYLGKEMERQERFRNGNEKEEKAREQRAEEYGQLADRVRASFGPAFWMEEKGYLKDVVSGTKADEQLRCNQIWAVSLPFTMLEREQEKKITDTVFKRLYTPYGLRTLEAGDGEFHPLYGGSMFERDMAYHQGTVWGFPLGGYYLAWLKVHDYSPQAKAYVEEQLEVLESAMREGCIGQLPEIYDGENPTASRGCFAQAWSVGELLRVYEAIERQE